MSMEEGGELGKVMGMIKMHCMQLFKNKNL